MIPFTAGVLYFLIWWTVLFAILPWGIRGQNEENSIIQGTEPGAPTNSHMWRKVKQTTIAAAIIWVIVASIIHFELISWNDLPFISFDSETNRYT